jgi:hypothetical protein
MLNFSILWVCSWDNCRLESQWLILCGERKQKTVGGLARMKYILSPLIINSAGTKKLRKWE